MCPLVLAMPREPSGFDQIAVLLQHRLVLHVVQVGVDDGRAVELDRDAPALGGDLLGVPFADRLLGTALRREHLVDEP